MCLQSPFRPLKSHSPETGVIWQAGRLGLRKSDLSGVDRALNESVGQLTAPLRLVLSLFNDKDVVRDAVPCVVNADEEQQQRRRSIAK